MAPLLLAAAPALISGAAAVGAQYYSSSAQAAANKKNLSWAEQSQEWQQYMAETAHQREMTDLRRAGLNPILSATGGAGAAVPGGAGYHAMPEMGNQDVGGAMAEGFSSGMAVQQREAELKNLEEMNRNIMIDTSLKASNQRLAAEQAQLLQDNYDDNRRKAGAEAAAAEETVLNLKKLGRDYDQRYQIGQSAEAQSRIDEEIFTKVPFLRWLDAISRSVQGVGSARNLWKGD